ncbi:ABC transporter ATP-binding protein [Ferrovum sp. PN-J185]|uniref:ABC transporter ATP-binding protein n=1 Tax=Ferrovum sp. PN-J185 TaxID=1356306 RepID=UPI001E42EF39|nr:ABC transporter ATP-binding protein [Ferrovum sp. PN-J185]MCC6068766.1 ABC transporter ATP-binding protein [Ferrovum sp. PN-J185]
MGSIVVTNLGKAYKQYPSRWSRLLEWLDPRGKSRHNSHWVLQDINFTVNPGEAVGIIGINGAGKSTLLKLITGTTQPTTGSVQINGRVAALLELGMGFHPDFTGRQNVYMAGQLLGYSVEEVSTLMPEIEAFAEIGEYIDQPVRVYSSGMQMRVAFSVATAIRPDILIVDEALSVGDAYFQHKSFERIRAFREKGTTLLIVSHDKGAIQSICDRALLLSNGKILLEGKPESIFDYYNAAIASDSNKQIIQTSNINGTVSTVSGNRKARILSISLRNTNNEEVEVIGVGEEIILEILVEITASIENLVVGFLIKDRLGQEIFGTNSYHLDKLLSNLHSEEIISYRYSLNANFGSGTYSIAAALHKTESHLSENYEWIDMAKIFQIVNLNRKHFIGVAWSEPKLEVSYE